MADRVYFPIRLQLSLVFLIIIGLSFAFAATRLTDYVSDYLFKQRIRQDSLSVERLATTLAPLFASAQEEALTESLASASGELGGRLLVLDMDGKVQFDAYTAMLGRRLPLPEVANLRAGASTSWGIYRTDRETLGSEYVACCGSQLIGPQGVQGMLLLISDVDEIMQSLETVKQELLVVFGVVALLAVLSVVLFSHILTRPITLLTRTIQTMGKGDLTVRAPLEGAGEIRRLAKSYNDMAQQLEDLDSDRNAFVSNASHELKTPMASMKVLLETILYQPEMPEAMRNEFLGDMNHEIDRLTKIVTDLLELTRMDNHQLKLNMTDVDLTYSVKEVIRLLEPVAVARGQQILLRATQSFHVQGDADRLKEIATNLIDNALKYSPDGANVVVSLNQKQKKVFFSVRDHGVGISEDDQKRIFDRFYRVDKARSRETGGTGLGLSIVKQLVYLHGGEITVDSTPGSGSVFTVILPAGSISGPKARKGAD